jgi:hypothetical protein
MAKKLTYNTLFRLDRDMIRIQQEQPALYLLLEPRIRFFYQRADIHLKAMMNGMNDIQKKFVQVDDHGKFRTEGEGDDQDWLYVPVITDFKTASIISDKVTIKKMFEEKVSEFMNITINLEL